VKRFAFFVRRFNLQQYSEAQNILTDEAPVVFISMTLLKNVVPSVREAGITQDTTL